jgi:hypothetical protein
MSVNIFSCARHISKYLQGASLVLRTYHHGVVPFGFFGGLNSFFHKNVGVFGLRKNSKSPFFLGSKHHRKSRNLFATKKSKKFKNLLHIFQWRIQGELKGQSPLPPQKCRKNLLKMVEKCPKMDPKQGVTPRQWG